MSRPVGEQPGGFLFDKIFNNCYTELHYDSLFWLIARSISLLPGFIFNIKPQ